ncbi:MAG TPA: gluconokinase [Chitinophaga sp.]|uniref:gluconokinase n=1 Tax=Chitinophaga sp. TaxID=1869181 RepID=UPI002DBBD94C|nr:gluconokinase [Chitinophaga sp.]HEU4552573.1 gluconokinase [Chitinophaga sp.]
MSSPLKYMIGVDIGTSSTKVIALLPSGHVQALYQQAYATQQPQPGHSEQNPHDILQAVTRGIRQVAQEMKQPPAGICFSSAMHSLMAVDAQGQPLTPLLTWADNRSQEIADALRPTGQGKALYYQTGTPIHPMTPLCKISWLRQHATPLFARTAQWLGIKEYVLYRLFGKYVADYSIASATGLFDIHALMWSPQAMQAAGITTAQLPEPVPTDHILRNLPEHVAWDLGIPADTPFIIGASDGCLAQLGSGALAPGHATLTIATSGALRIATTKPVRDEQQRIFNYILDARHFVTGGPVNNGGIILQWFVRDFLQQKDADLDTYIEQALAIPPGAAGLVCLPYLLGERAPVWDGHARGVFIGVQPQHTAMHFMRAAMEGIAFGLLSIANALRETAGPLQQIAVSGGFTASPGWIQLMADVFQQPMHLEQQNDASALGAAMMGFGALGIAFEGLPAATATIYTPRTEHAAVYEKHYRLYSELYGRLKDVMHQL